MKDRFITFRSAILAGIAISFGCIVYLKVGGVAGAALFAFGLLTCISFKLKLYTGTAGFVGNRAELGALPVILAGNITGCFLTAMLTHVAIPELQESAGAIVARRLEYDWLQALLLSICCGFIMTVAVKMAREGKFLPLLFGVPLFILCGFIHSIADAFYTLASPALLLADNLWPLLLFYAIIVIGNFIGCNLYRIVLTRLTYDA